MVKRYAHKDVKTPLERLVELDKSDLATLKPGVSLAAMQAQAPAKTDLQAAQDMQRAKAVLFARLNKPRLERGTA